jgi:MFS family permease
LNPWRGLGSLRREIWFLCLAILINRVGTMVLPFLTLYLTVDRRFPAATAGLTLTIYGLCAIIVAPIAGRLTDRVGGLQIMKASLILSGLLLFVFPFIHSIYGIFVITGFWAIANESFRPPSMAIIGDLAGPQQRKAAFALTRLAINLGMSIGPVVGGFLAMRSFKLIFLVDGTTSLLAGVVIALLPWQLAANSDATDGPEPEPMASTRPVAPPRYLDVLKDRRFITFWIAMLPVELVFFQSLAAMPLFLVGDLHLTEAGFGAIVAINTVIIILVEVPLNSAMADWSHKNAIGLGGLLIGVGFAAVFLANNAGVAAAAVVIWTFGEMILLPASSAFVSDLAPREQAGAYMGLYTMGFSVALAIGPWLGTQLLVHYGPRTVAIGILGCGLVTSAIVWLRFKTQNSH